MDLRVIPSSDLSSFLAPALNALGFPPVPERTELMKLLPELGLLVSAFDGEQAVGSAGAYCFAMTTSPGKKIEIAGITMVGVLPTHRRRGVLTALMRQHLEDAHRRKISLAALWASEGSIYQRFGYGMASLAAEIEIDLHHASFLPSVPKPAACLRLVSEDEAALVFPGIWDRVRERTPGMLSRSIDWWRLRRVGDPSWVRSGRAPLQRLLVEIDGSAVGYAIYRLLDSGWDSHNLNTLSAEVIEAVGDGLPATVAVWKHLFSLDLVRSIKAKFLPLDHPLTFLLTEARRQRMHVYDALWVRLVDVESALNSRTYAAGPKLVFAVSDSFCPWNEGHFKLEGGVAQRTTEPADLSLSCDALASIYLGGFRASQLGAAGRIVEATPGALAAADAMFSQPLLPWVPEIF